MARRLTRIQLLQNAAFLRALRRTGNARDAARACGIHRSTLTKRRAAHPSFAAEWDAALALAHASLLSMRAGEGAGTSAGRDPQLVQRADGRLQLRASKARRIDRAAEHAFLAALSATANIRLSAAAAGFAHSSFYALRRRNPGFAREMQLALEMGYERLEMALLESFEVEAHAHDAWRHNDPPPLPQMTANQALQLLHLHHKTAKLWAEAPYMNRRPGETWEMWSARRAAEHRAQITREAQSAQIAATAAAPDKPANQRYEPPPPILPALDQVTGWSKADPTRPPHDPTRALFGGWRLGDVRGK